MDNTELAQFRKEAAKFVAVRRTKKRRRARIGNDIDGHGLWTKLGSGYYGEAWVHDKWPEFALKISGRAGWGDPHWFYRTDDDSRYSSSTAPRLDAWPVFAKHCQEHPHQHLPKVLHIETVSRGITWAVMPKYEKVEWQWQAPAVVLALTEYYQDPESDIPPEWVKNLVDLAEKYGLTFDMHSGNYMQDDEYNVVIIDPFSTTQEPIDMAGDWIFN